MATLAGQMTMLRHLAPHWSAVSLAASLLFCAAILLRPLTTADLNPTAPMSPIAEPVEMKALKSVAGVRKAIRHLGDDALVVRVSATAP
jgi:hypothetical protein